MCFDCYHSLSIFSRQQIDDIFLIFPRKQDLTFHANCLLRKQFAWNVKSFFLGKIKKNISKCRLLKILPRVLSIKAPLMLSMLGKHESRWHFKIFFLVLTPKTGSDISYNLSLKRQFTWRRCHFEIFFLFFFQENTIWHSIQIVSKERQFVWNVKFYFLRKINTKYHQFVRAC